MALERLVKVLSSLWVTVTCLALGVLLVFIGTLAQTDLGLYAAQAKYFRSLVVFWTVPGSGLRLPVFPGGYLIGGVLLVNLTFAFSKRFGFRRDKIGLGLVHAGLVLLLVGQLATDLLQVESTIRLVPGETKSYSEDFRGYELALVSSSDATSDEVVAIPESHLVKLRAARVPQLPFSVQPKSYWPNSELFTGATNGAVAAAVTQGAGRSLFLRPLAPTTSPDERNVPSAVVELTGAQGSLGTWLVAGHLRPQEVSVDGRRYELSLRVRRHYNPFAITLLEARHDIYPGTDIPKNFSSRVRVRRPVTGEDREVLIYMNNPLRYGGQTFYQYQMSSESAEKSSTLQVVRNPGWLTPYLSCALVAAGLLYQFLSHLAGFVRRKTA